MSAVLLGCSADALEPSSFTARANTSTLRGVNLAGAEFGADAWGMGALPGQHGSDYVYPSPTYASGYHSAESFVEAGMNTFRLPFRWERLQPTRGQALNAAELGRLRTTVDELTALGARVILDPHNYARYGQARIGNGVTDGEFADFWERLAEEFGDDAQVIFALVNEPHDMPTADWVKAANAALAAIRNTGADNLVLVPGNHWTGAHSWDASWLPASERNSVAMLDIVDPANNFAFEVHQYLDEDSSGTSASCAGTQVGAERLEALTAWLEQHGYTALLGEFGAGDSQTCLTALDGMLDHMEAHEDAYIGWTYWAAGPWWGNYFTSIEPGVGDAQMEVLAKHLDDVPTGGDGGNGDGGNGDGDNGDGGNGDGGNGDGGNGDGGAVAASVVVTNNWGSGYCANLVVENQGSAPISGWTVVLNTQGTTIYNTWNGTYDGAAGQVTVTPVGWNANIAPGGHQSPGFCATGNGGPAQVVDASGE